MKHGKIYVAGIGPGSEEDITPAVRTAIMQSDVVVGTNITLTSSDPSSALKRSASIPG